MERGEVRKKKGYKNPYKKGGHNRLVKKNNKNIRRNNETKNI